MNYHTANLLNTAAVCSNYLGRTCRGAIDKNVRAGAIFAMNGLAAEVTHLHGQVANLQAQLQQCNGQAAVLTTSLAGANETIRTLKAELAETTLKLEKATQDSEELVRDLASQAATTIDDALAKEEERRNESRIAAENFTAIITALETEFREEEEAYTLTVIEHQQSLEQKLVASNLQVQKERAAKENAQCLLQKLVASNLQVQKERAAKENAHCLLQKLMEFVVDQKTAVVGYFWQKYRVDLDFEVVGQLFAEMQDNAAWELRDDGAAMEVLRALSGRYTEQSGEACAEVVGDQTPDGKFPFSVPRVEELDAADEDSHAADAKPRRAPVVEEVDEQHSESLQEVSATADAADILDDREPRPEEAGADSSLYDPVLIEDDGKTKLGVVQSQGTDPSALPLVPHLEALALDAVRAVAEDEAQDPVLEAPSFPVRASNTAAPAVQQWCWH